MTDGEEDHERLARIETKIDSLLEKLADHESRIRKLEKIAARMLGAFVAIWAAIQLAWEWLKPSKGS